MKSLRLNQIEDDAIYQVDLVQLDDGLRFIHIRGETDLRHPNAALSSVRLAGTRLRVFLLQRRMDESVVTEDGEMFGIDPHDSWMVLSEAKFWRYCREHDKTDWENGPWINGKPPKLAT